jgi:DNA polymerase IIIc chi subunit
VHLGGADRDIGTGRAHWTYHVEDARVAIETIHEAKRDELERVWAEMVAPFLPHDGAREA